MDTVGGITGESNILIVLIRCQRPSRAELIRVCCKINIVATRNNQFVRTAKKGIDHLTLRSNSIRTGVVRISAKQGEYMLSTFGIREIFIFPFYIFCG